MKRYLLNWLHTGLYVVVPVVVIISVYFLTYLIPFYWSLLVVAFVVNTLLAFDYDRYIKNRGDK